MARSWRNSADHRHPRRGVGAAIFLPDIRFCFLTLFLLFPILLSKNPGVDVMITIFGDFCQFSAKNFAFFSTTNVMIKFCEN
jgi:hypothetical protein